MNGTIPEEVNGFEAVYDDGWEAKWRRGSTEVEVFQSPMKSGWEAVQREMNSTGDGYSSRTVIVTDADRDDAFDAAIEHMEEQER